MADLMRDSVDVPALRPGEAAAVARGADVSLAKEMVVREADQQQHGVARHVVQVRAPHVRERIQHGVVSRRGVLPQPRVDVPRLRALAVYRPHRRLHAR